MQEKTVILVKTEKSMGISIFLTIVFGPIGLFFASIVGGVAMCILSVIVGIATLGVGLPITWLMSILWGILSVSSYNQQLRDDAERFSTKAA